MGIDIYTKWKGQTKAEHQAQFTGFDTEAGNMATSEKLITEALT